MFIFATELGEFFILSVSAESEGISKPERGIFDRARQKAEQLTGQSLPEESVVHVGDNLLHDVQGARQAGLRAVWMQHHSLVAEEDRHRYEIDKKRKLFNYPDTAHIDNDQLLRADAEISDLAELPGILESLG